jgi:methyl-accepting chemotaxis protein
MASPASRDPNPADDRQAFEIELHHKAQVAGTWFILPGAALAYFSSALRHPCWQTITLAVAVVAMGILWTLGFRRAAKGQIEPAVRLVCGGGLGFGVLVLFLREDASLSIAATFLALTAYVALFSSRYLYVTSVVAATAILSSELAAYLGLLDRFAIPGATNLVVKLGFVAMFWAIATYFLRRTQVINALVLGRVEEARRRQKASLDAVVRAQPKVDAVVSEVRQIADGLASQAAEHAATTSQVTQSAKSLADTVSGSAQAAQAARSIAEATRVEAQAGSSSLAAIEHGFQGAVDFLDSLRTDIARLNSELAATEEINATIADISENLRIAGVNAKLEAARAGEHARGFSAIAEHLVRMIDKSSEDVKRSRALLQSLQRRAEELDGRAEASLTLMQRNFSDLKATTRSMESINNRFAEAVDQVNRISEATGHQREGISAIASAMTSLEQAASQFSPAAVTLNLGMERLASLQQELRDSVLVGHA